MLCIDDHGSTLLVSRPLEDAEIQRNHLDLGALLVADALALIFLKLGNATG